MAGAGCPVLWMLLVLAQTAGAYLWLSGLQQLPEVPASSELLETSHLDSLRDLATTTAAQAESGYKKDKVHNVVKGLS